MQTSASQDIDANRKVITGNDSFLLRSAWTFVATTTGTQAAHTLFTVTGDVLVNLFAICTTNLTGAGSGAVGTVNNTTALITTTVGTDIDATEVWQNDTPTVEVGAVVSTSKPIASGADIILTISGGTFTAGVVTFYCTWRPLSTTGFVSVTTPA